MNSINFAPIVMPLMAEIRVRSILELELIGL